MLHDSFATKFFSPSEPTKEGRNFLFDAAEPKKKSKGPIVYPMHQLAVNTNFLSDQYPGLYDTIEVSEEEAKLLADLEQNMDFCVLKARMDNADIRNENTSIAAEQKSSDRQGDDDKEKGDLCGARGDISNRNRNKFAREKAKHTNWIDFPMANLNDEFGPHWSREDETCQSNSFTYKDPSHFSLNNVRFSYRRFKEIMDREDNKSSDTYKRAFFHVIYPGEDWKAFKKKPKDEQYEMYGQAAYSSFRMRKKFIEQYERDQDDNDPLLDIVFSAPTPPSDIAVEFEQIVIANRFGDDSVTETLQFDTRLLHNENRKDFRELEVPPILMGTILRKGTADFHCVYFEDKNAMGQLDKWATILIVRPGEIDEYVRRYTSEHTYFIQLPVRKAGADEKSQGYSAGDSKYYCWRVADWLHEHWAQGLSAQKKRRYYAQKRRCIIMDDQMNPFVHQAPRFTPGYKIPKHYAFRASIKDKVGVSMIDRPNIRFIIPHAAAFMYANNVANITQAGLICMNSKEADIHDSPLCNRPFANAVWFINIDVMSKKLAKKPFLQSALQPAYQAAEDTLMRAVCTDRNIRMVVCSTVRWRKQQAGGGTCGRACVKETSPNPYRPVIKYRDLAKMYTFSDAKGITMMRTSKINKTARIVRDCAPLELYALDSKRITFRTRSIMMNHRVWIRYKGLLYKTTVEKKAQVSWNKGETYEQINFSNAYTPRHIISVFIFKMMNLIDGVGKSGKSSDSDSDSDSDDDSDSDSDSEMNVGTRVIFKNPIGPNFSLKDKQGEIVEFTKTKKRATVEWDGGVSSKHNTSSLGPVLGGEQKSSDSGQQSSDSEQKSSDSGQQSSVIRYPFDDCIEGHVYRDQDGDYIYYLEDGDVDEDGYVDVYGPDNLPRDNTIFDTLSEFAEWNKDAVLRDVGEYAEQDVYHAPILEDRVSILWKNQQWYNGTITKITKSHYTVTYDDKQIVKHTKNALSKMEFKRTWKWII